MKIFSIKDKKSGAFDNPFYRSSYAEAERSFQMLAKDEKTMIHHSLKTILSSKSENSIQLQEKSYLVILKRF